MKLLVLDFETRDPYLSSSINLGGGWVYGMHVPTSRFKVLGYSFCYIDTGVSSISTPLYIPLEWDKRETRPLSRKIKMVDGIVMHNALYDLGCLMYLGIDISKLKIYDTKIIAHLYDNNLFSYSLDYLSQRYLPSEQQKKKASLVDVAIKHNMCVHLLPKREKYNVETYHKKVEKWCYENMDVIQEKDLPAMAFYAQQDVVATANLFLHFTKDIELEQAEYWSSFQKICVTIRSKGIKVDIQHIKKSIKILEKQIEDLKQELILQVGDINLDSPKQLGEVLTKLGYKLPKTEKGADAVNKDFLTKNNDDKLLGLILKYRTTKKICRDFFEKLLDIQQYTCPEALVEGAKYGRVYPELKVFGAATGRFSSSSPNIQQIPKRDEQLGDLSRAIFIPDNPEKQWYSLDWSNQEGRLALHYAKTIGAQDVDQLVTEFQLNPSLDMHAKVGELASISRSQAKTINLGIMYSMGQAKLCKALGLPTEWVKYKGRKIEVAGAQGKALLERYYEYMPWIKQLDATCKDTLLRRGNVRTIGNRLLKKEEDHLAYKALNKLIQGSAADQCLMVLKAAFDAGVDIKCVVHDEFNIEGTIVDACFMKDLMENTLKLHVPMVAEVKSGNSWGDLHKVEVKNEKDRAA